MHFPALNGSRLEHACALHNGFCLIKISEVCKKSALMLVHVVCLFIYNGLARDRPGKLILMVCVCEGGGGGGGGLAGLVSEAVMGGWVVACVYL